MYSSFFDVLRNWVNGEEIVQSYTLYGIKCLWYGRGGQIFQFIGGLTLLVEILGIEKIKRYNEEVNKAIQSKGLRDLFNVHIIGFAYVLDFTVFGNPARKYIKESLQGLGSSDYSNFFRYRGLIQEWKSRRPQQYQKVINIRRRARAYKGIKKFILYTVILFCFPSTTINTWLAIMAIFSNVSILVLIPLAVFAGVISFAVGLVAVSVLAFILQTLVIFAFWSLTAPYLIFYVLLKLMVLLPLNGFFSLSKNERLYKMVSLLFIGIGFFLSLVFG